MSEFASAFLCNPYVEPVEMFIIPALHEDISKKFPFLSLIHCLQDSKFNSKLLVNDSWLLHSVLSLEPPGFGKCHYVFFTTPNELDVFYNLFSD